MKFILGFVLGAIIMGAFLLNWFSNIEADSRIDFILDKMSEETRYQRIWFDGLHKEVTITAYNPLKSQTDDNPWETASGTIPTVQSLALSRDLLVEYGGSPYCYGDIVYIILPFRVEDTMNIRYKNRADIFMERKWAAKIFGNKIGFLAN